MKTYSDQIRIFGYELADETIKKEKDKNWISNLDRFKIASSISKIYDIDLIQVTDDLDKSIKLNLKKIKIRG